MVELQKRAKDFEKLNVQLVGVSYDSVEVLKRFSEKHKVAFPVLSDAGSKVIKKYKLHFQRGLPHPGTLLIDQNGVVQAKLFEEGYRKRHTPEDLLKEASILFEKQKEAAKKK